ncbi:MAG: helix-turn-helix domain-containing protein [Planctomycetaceae bacterium]|nr:helix-turn-helix domain-containing protein [Planctomycetaceae bacterium]
MTAKTNQDRLILKCSEAARLCGVDQKTWRLWYQQGYIPPPVRVGRSLFWRMNELVKWIEAGCPKYNRGAY